MSFAVVSRVNVRTCPIVLAMISFPRLLSAALSLSLGSGSGAPACTIALGVTLTADGEIRPSALQWTISYSSDIFTAVQVSAESAASATDKSLVCSGNTGTITCLLMGLNNKPLSGGLIANVHLQISPRAPDGAAKVQITTVAAALPDGTETPIAASDGVMSISSSSAFGPAAWATGVLNAASNLNAPIAAGEMVRIRGCGMGDKAAVAGAVDASQMLQTVVGGTTVLFDGTPAPLNSVRNDEVTAVVPYEIAAQTRTQLLIQRQGATSVALDLPVAVAAPAIFTVDSSGVGPGAIVNEDGSGNSPQNPARPGSTVSLYATGGGSTDPAGITAKVPTDVLPRPILPVSVSVDGADAPIVYAGAAPSLIGILQINVQIPNGIRTGNVSLSLSVGPISSPSGVTISVGGAQ